MLRVRSVLVQTVKPPKAHQVSPLEQLGGTRLNKLWLISSRRRFLGTDRTWELFGNSGIDWEAEVRGLGEGAEIAVAGDEGNACVHTVLCNQGISEASPATLREDFCA